MSWKTIMIVTVASMAVATVVLAEDPPPDALVDAVSEFYESVETGDVEARIALLAEDVLLMPNHWTIMNGRESIAASLRGTASAVFRIRDRRVLRMEVSGDLAFTVNSYLYTYHAVDAAEQWHRTKNVHVWRRDNSGAWRLAVDIWNSDVPMEQFNAE